MKLLSKFIVLAATISSIWIASAFSATTRTQPCSVDNIPVSLSIGGVPLKIGNAGYLSTSEGPVNVKVEVTNELPLSIEHLALVLEFQNDNSESLGQVPFIGGLSSPPQKQNWPFHAEYHDPFSVPLKAGENHYIRGISTTISTTCPTRARVLYVGVELSDKTQKSWSSPDWVLGPILNFFPGTVTTMNGISIPSTLIFRAKIDERGNVVGTQPDSGSPSDFNTLDILKAKTWEFFPAIKNGIPVESELAIVVQFLPAPDKHIPSDIADASNYVMLKIVPDQTEAHQWRVWCEWREGNSRVE
jgi:hypothetical protein